MATLKTVLFDLDGTLLPMDQDVFARTYFAALAKKLAPCGYEFQPLIDGIWTGTRAMMKNDGADTNEAVFWKTFEGLFGERVRQDEPIFEAFYREDFDKVSSSCGFNPAARETVYALRDMGLRLALATNPIFPAVATRARIRWAGLCPEDFELYTTYETSSYCKPNPAYYQHILDELGCRGEECLMVGNDVEEDMAAEALGMRVFLLTDCLINKHGADISVYPHGDFAALLDYVRAECNI